MEYNILQEAGKPQEFKMKKALILLTVIFIAALSSCFRKDEKEETEVTTTVTATTTTTAETTTPVSSPTTTAIFTSVTESIPEEAYENPIVKTAEALMGIEFAQGGASPSEGFDNSGFIYYVLRENGYIGCPRQISAQLDWGENVGFEEIKAGDVAYFSAEPDGEASFGGIYAGNGIMIYSPYPGEKVKTADITAPYWQSRFVTALSL